MEGAENEDIWEGRAGRCAKDGFFNLLLKNGNNLASAQSEVKERERGE